MYTETLQRTDVDCNHSVKSLSSYIFRPGACAGHRPARLVSEISLMREFMPACVCVCLYTPEAIFNYWRGFDFV